MDIRVVIPPLPSPDQATVGAIIYSVGFESRVVYTIACSCRADADASLYGFMLEESDEPESNLNTVDPDDFIDHEPLLTTTARSGKVEYIGGKRYTRLTVVPLGKGGLAVTAMALLGNLTGEGMDDGEANADSEACAQAFGQALDKEAVASPQTRWRGSQGSSDIVKGAVHAQHHRSKPRICESPTTICVLTSIENGG